MTLGGADPAAFVLAPPTLPLTLQPGRPPRKSAVSFKPEAERPFTAHLVVESSDTDSPSVAVPMSGTGVRPRIQLSESSLEFGQQLLHNTSGPRKVRVTNNSDAHVTLATLAVEGAGASQFTLARPPLPLVLEPGQGQEVGVTFTPLAEAEVNGTLKLTFSEPAAAARRWRCMARASRRCSPSSPSPLDFGGSALGTASASSRSPSPT